MKPFVTAIIAIFFGAPALAHGATRVPIYRSVDEIVDRVLCPIAGYMFGILIAIAVIMILVAAYMYATSRGDPERVRSATKTITYATVAVVVAITARAFPAIILSTLSQASSSSFFPC